MSVPLRTSHTIAPIADLWSRLATELYSLPNWLATAETRAAGGCRYALLDGEEDGPRGALVAYPTGPDGWFFTNPVALLTRWAEAPAEHLDAEERQALERYGTRLATAADDLYPALVSVLPSGYLPGLLRADPAPDAELAAALEHLAAEGGHPVAAVMHVREEDTGLRRTLTGRGYLPFATAGDCVLRTPWPDFDGYLAALPTARRNRVRREVRDFAASGAVLREVTLDDLTESHAQLHAGHLRRYGHDVQVESSRQLIENIRTHRTGRGRVLEARRGDQLAGYVVFYEFADSFHPKMIGIADGERRAFTYFNLCYYGLVRTATAESVPAISYGPEAYQAKALRGCTLEHRINHVLLPPALRETAAPVAHLLDLAHRRRMDAHAWAANPAAAAAG